MKASSDRVQSEVSQMSESSKPAQRNSDGRLWRRPSQMPSVRHCALKQISELSETKLSVVSFGCL